MDRCRPEHDARVIAGPAVPMTAEPAIGKLVSLAVRAYQLSISPLLGMNCRFEPSCSRFSAEAIRRHGILRGGALAFRRLLRCQPWGGPGGYDPVP